MEFPPQQDAALRDVDRWFKLPVEEDQVYYLAGYAGSGKTTLARYLAEQVDGRVVFAAYTGKAAAVLRAKGCAGAQTIHSLIYHPKEKSRQGLLAVEQKMAEVEAALLVDPTPALRAQMEQLKRQRVSERRALRQLSFELSGESELAGADLVVIDECSMVDERIGRDLESFRKKILVLGDPAQLPPVMGGGYFTSRQPNTMLTEIHRQAAESPIIRMATDVREGRAVAMGDHGSGCHVIPKSQTHQNDYMSADQILCGRNATRHAVNKRYRQLVGNVDWKPREGDRLVCLRNDHKVGLLNGTLWRAVEDATQPIEDRLCLTVEPEEGGPQLEVTAHACHLRGDREELPWYERKEAQEFDYGYALTVHKAQGSQWNDVLVIDESGVFRENARRWLYTALTRAAVRVTVVR